MSSSLGQLFKVTTFGESHGAAIGCVIDGCLPNMTLDLGAVQTFLNRRRPGQSALTTSREEGDTVEVISGVEDGKTLGSPVTLIVRNTNIKKSDYEELSSVFRPSHADFTTLAKYGVRAKSGGGRASARETIGRVAAASVASQMLSQLGLGIDVVAYVARVENVESRVDESKLTRADVEKSPVRCPDADASQRMEALISEVKTLGDSVGGVIRTIIRGVPAGLGEPVFDKLEASFARAMMSLPASKSFEVGDGLASTFARGSQNNDAFFKTESGQIATRTNHSGGIQGGISNGMDIVLSVGFKPVSTIFLPQETVDDQGEARVLELSKGRHDPCVLPRAVPTVEAMAWLVLADHVLLQRALAPTLKEQNA